MRRFGWGRHLTIANLSVCRTVSGFRAFARQGLEESDQLLADLATQVPGLAGIARADQCAQFHRVYGHVGNLQPRHLAVPQRALADDFLKLLTQAVHRHRIADPEEDRADLRGTLVGPVLERLLDEIAQRHHHPPQVPQPDHDVGAGDRFDPAGFALDHHLVLDPYRLGHRDLY